MKGKQKKSRKRTEYKSRIFFFSFKSKTMLHLCHTDRTCGHTGAIKNESGFYFLLRAPIISARRPTDSRIIIFYLRRGVRAGRRYGDRRGLAASTVSETDYLRRVLGRLLIANTSDRTSRARKRYHARIARY